MGGRAQIVAALAALIVPALALAQDTAPANTLMDMRRQFAACKADKPIGPAGSRVTFTFAMKRDGSIFGKPRITYSHLEGDKAARRALPRRGRRSGQRLPAVQDHSGAWRGHRGQNVLDHGWDGNAGAGRVRTRVERQRSFPGKNRDAERPRHPGTASCWGRSVHGNRPGPKSAPKGGACAAVGFFANSGGIIIVCEA